LQQAAIDAHKELSDKFDLDSIKTQAEMEKFYSENIDTIKDIVINHVDSKLGDSIENGVDVLTAVDDYARSITPGSKMTLEEIKTTGAESLKKIESVSVSFSKDKIFKS